MNVELSSVVSRLALTSVVMFNTLPSHLTSMMTSMAKFNAPHSMGKCRHQMTWTRHKYSTLAVVFFLLLLVDSVSGTCTFRDGLLGVIENTPVGTDIGTIPPNHVTVHSWDEGDNVTLTGDQYPLQFIDIDASRRAFVVKKEMDLENMTTNELNFKFSCNGATGDLTVTVFNIDDEPPVFLNPPYNVTISELTRDGEMIYDLSGKAVDSDFGQKEVIRFSLDAHGAPFRHGESVKYIVVDGSLDYDNGPKSYVLSITAWDNALKNVSTTLTVYLSDGDDQNPAFTQTQYTWEVLENNTAAINKPVSTQPPIHAYDLDFGINQTVEYSLEGAGSELFVINSSSGEVALRQVLDREQTDEYTLKIKAVQTNAPLSRLAVAILQIVVKDANDHVPVMSSSHYSASLLENAKEGTIVTQVSATDGDEGINAMFEYRISPPSDTFTINRQTGFIQVKNPAKLDFESRQSLQFQVYAVEINSAQNFSSAYSTVNVTLRDVNDNNPIFHPDTYYFTINETWPQSVPLGKVYANDSDSAENGQVMYRIISATNGGLSKFRIDDSTGSLFVADSLSNNYQPLYTLTVMAEDKAVDPSQRRRTSVVVTINVTDVNNNPPHFIPPSPVNLPEMTPMGTFVQQLTATDLDSDAVLKYSLISGGNGAFKVNALTGVVETVQLLDREEKAFYSLTIGVSDGQFSENAILNVTILDVNDNVPQFSQSKYEYTVVEEKVSPLTGVIVYAEDSDMGDNSKIIYSIASSWAKEFFEIDSGTGTLSARKLLDREVDANYAFTVSACDNGIPKQCNATDVSVKVLDINDNGPVAVRSTEMVEIGENAAATVLLKIEVTDADDGENGIVKYALTSGNQTLFKIDPDSGQLSTRVKLDHEAQKQYTLEVLAYNVVAFQGPAAVNMTNATVTVTVNVKDINDNPPLFTQNLYHAQVKENHNIGFSVIRVIATDSDSNAEIRYTIDGPTKFNIDDTMGIISLKDHLDYEKGDTGFIIQVTAADRSLNSTASVNITVIDVNDNPPVFQRASYTVNVLESANVNDSVIASMNVTDVDSGENGRVTFSIDDQVPFAVDAVTGEITVSKPLDFEKSSDYSFRVIASDHGHPPLSSSAQVNVRVTDINDSPPEFSHRVYNFSLVELSPLNFFVGSLRATDEDTQLLNYTIITADLKALRIELTTGNLFTAAILDYEKVQSYTLEVQVTDGKSIDQATVNVLVTDVNDNSPMFNQSKYEANLPENMESQSLIQVYASDKDSGALGKVTYRIVSGNDIGLFGINTTTGVLSVKKGADYEEQARHVLYVEARDGGTPPRASAVPVVVNVLDKNDKAPSFQKNIYQAQVAENYPSGALVVQLTVSDVDSKIFNYTIVGGSNYFEVDSSGSVKTSQMLDRELQYIHELNVSVCDPDLCDYTMVNISVIDVNDNPPRFLRKVYLASVPEDAAIGRPIVTVKASDADTGHNSELTYWLVDHDGKFEIDYSSGEIHLTGQLDEKIKSKYEMTVYVVDHGIPSLLSNVSVVVFVNASNLHAPRFLEFSYFASFPENINNGTVIIVVNATDDDTGASGQIDYSIISGNNMDTFSISSTGVITNSKTLDYESERFYELVVQVTDKAQDPKSSTAIVRMVVTDYNDNAPEFAEMPDIVRISNQTPVGKVIFAAKAFDADSDLNGNNEVKYNMSTTSSFFSLDADSGNITVLIALNSGWYNLTIMAFDLGLPQRSSTVDLHLEVFTPPGPYQPRFRDNYYVKYVVENTFPASIADINAFQRINGSNDAGITYNITHGHRRDHYAIDSQGLITLSKPLDREDIAKQSLLVTAYGRGSSNELLSAEVGVYVFISDVNDNAPRFPFSQYDVTVTEDQPIDHVVTTVTAVDPDEKSELTYSIVRDDSNVSFAINNQGQITIKNPLDHETMPVNLSSIYTLEINVSDGNYPGSNTSVRILVQDVNDNAPVFNSSVYYINVTEDIQLKVPFTRLHATDVDLVDQGLITYSIIEGNQDDHFGINNYTGDLYVVTSLDRETKEQFLLTVLASDSALNNVSCQVNVTVTDVNDNAPSFTASSYQGRVLEGGASLSLVVNITATDADVGTNSELSFSILGDDHFNISSSGNTAALKVVKELDREKGLEYSNGSAVFRVTVQVRDHGTPIRTSTTVVVIYVDDINDNPPVFKEPQYTVPSFSEGSSVGSVILTVVATDGDYLPKYTGISYSIDTSTDPNGMFEIDSGTGVVKLAKRLDITKQEHYNLTLRASDGQLNSSVNLYITLVDVNDNDPVFAQSVYYFNVSENDAGGDTNQFVGQVNATDKDRGSNGEIEYRLSSRNAKDLFNISQDGKITSVGKLNREETSEYVIIVTAKDKGVPFRQGTCEVVITVLDVNDNAPEFAASNYLGSVAEHSTDGAAVLVDPPIKVTDRDTGTNEQFRYTLIGEGSHLFIISDQYPVVKLVVHTNDSTALDREKQNSYFLQIVATDALGKGLNATANLSISLTDINDKKPHFDQSPYAFFVLENVSSNALVGQVNASDGDIENNKVVQYSIVTGSAGKFYIDRVSGEIFTTGGLDRETEPYYLLNVSAQDRGVTPFSLETYVTVNVTLIDINDNVPTFDHSSVVFHVAEDVGNGFVVSNLTVTDLDLGDNSKVSYMPLNTSLPFAVDKAGWLTVRSALNREKTTDYVFDVRAMDSGRPPLTGTVTVTVIIDDINDEHPKFAQTQYHVNILEKSPVNSPIAYPLATDADVGSNARLTFSLEGLGIDYFKINNVTALISIAKTIDKNELLNKKLIGNGVYNDTTDNSTLVLTIVATDMGKPPRSGTALLLVKVDEINDDTPKFNNMTYKVHIDEELDAGTYVTTVSASVKSPSVVMKYYIENSDAFKMHDKSGNITTAKRLDRELVDKYTFTVRAVDGRIPERTAYAVVTVTVDDVNDHAPVFRSTNLQFAVPEGDYSHRVLTTLWCSDDDVGVNSQLVYSLEGAGVVDVNRTTGEVFIDGLLDRENVSSYNMIVTVADQGQPSRNSTTRLTLTVDDINDNAPQYYRYPLPSIDIKENQPPGILVTTVFANDTDSGINGKVLYSIEGAASNMFYVVNKDSVGYVRTQNSLDYEKQSWYNISVVAHDLGLPRLQTTIQVIVNVTDMNDTPPKFAQKVYQVSIDDKTPIGSLVIQLYAGLGALKFTVIDDPNNGLFGVNSTGAITVAKKLSIVSEITYNLTVMAEDNYSPSSNDTTMVKITVKRTSKVPVFDKPTYNIVFNEGQKPPLLLVDLNTTEELAGLPILYTIVSGNELGFFSIQNSTGKVFCVKQLDRETVSSYTLKVRGERVVTRRRRAVARKLRAVEDPNIVTLVVTVGDVNDNPPVFQDVPYVFGVPSDASLNYVIGTIKATDGDTGTSDLKYELEAKGDDHQSFYLEPDTGVLYSRTKSIDSAKKMFDLNVKATDESGAGLSSVEKIKVFVLTNNYRVILSANVPKQEILDGLQPLIGNLSSILGYNVHVEKVEMKVDVDKVNPDATDIYIFATDSKGALVTRDDLLKRINENSAEIEKLFSKYKLVGRSLPALQQTSDIGALEASFISLGGVLFLACIVGLIVAIISWKKREAERVRNKAAKNSLYMRPEEVDHGYGLTMENPAFSADELDQSDVDSEHMRVFALEAGRDASVITLDNSYSAKDLYVNIQREATSSNGSYRKPTFVPSDNGTASGADNIDGTWMSPYKNGDVNAPKKLGDTDESTASSDNLHSSGDIINVKPLNNVSSEEASDGDTPNIVPIDEMPDSQPDIVPVDQKAEESQQESGPPDVLHDIGGAAVAQTPPISKALLNDDVTPEIPQKEYKAVWWPDELGESTSDKEGDKDSLPPSPDMMEIEDYSDDDFPAPPSSENSSTLERPASSLTQDDTVSLEHGTPSEIIIEDVEDDFIRPYPTGFVPPPPPPVEPPPQPPSPTPQPVLHASKSISAAKNNLMSELSTKLDRVTNNQVPKQVQQHTTAAADRDSDFLRMRSSVQKPGKLNIGWLKGDEDAFV